MSAESKNSELLSILQQISQQLSGGSNHVDEGLLSARGFAELLACSESAVLKGCRNGTFPAPTHKIFTSAKGLRWDMATVRTFIESSRILPHEDEEQDEPAPPFRGLRRIG